MAELLTSSTGCRFEKAKPIDSLNKASWSTTNVMDSNFSIRYDKPEEINMMFDFKYEHGQFKSIFLNTGLPWDKFEELNLIVKGVKLGINFFGSMSTGLPWDKFEELNLIVKGVKNINQPIEQSTNFGFRNVDVTYSKPNPDSEFRYIPTTDFLITAEVVSFTGDFEQPIDYDLVKTRLSPVDSTTIMSWDKTTPVDAYQRLTYGYGLNNFLIGGGVRLDYKVDDDAINPVDPPIITEVIRLVNTINVVKLPERTPVNFTNFTLSHDLDSIAWVVNFDIADEATLNLIKPSGLTTVDLEININGELFIVFIARTSTGLKGDRVKGVQRNIRCTGYSRTKLLTHPYISKRSRTETSSSTPAGIMANELAGTGFAGVWSSPTWTLPANRFSYFDKSPLAAISELAESIGSVLVPSPDTDILTVLPRYPTSPWNWGIVVVDRTLNESEFFSVDTDWQPREKPDSVYVYGEENGGAAVKCVQQGTAALVTLPDVVNKYITDTIAGTERGRIEIAKNHIDEVIPVTTYVSTVDGVIKPRELLEINALGGGTWRGMVSAVSLSIVRNGSAIIQSLKIERRYD